jgi:tetratricopeptide (TPR) repeat protein
MIYHNRGGEYYHLDKLDLAIKDFEKCVELEPTFIESRNYLSNCYAQIGSYEKALEIVNETL